MIALSEEPVCGVCGRTAELPNDLRIVGDIYCDRHDPKVQMVTAEHIDQIFLDYLEKKHGKSISLEEADNQ